MHFICTSPSKYKAICTNDFKNISTPSVIWKLKVLFNPARSYTYTTVAFPTESGKALSHMNQEQKGPF